MNAQLFKLQQQIATTLIVKLEQHEITWERAGQVARQIQALLPSMVTDDQLKQVINDIVRIPELSNIEPSSGVSHA